MKKMLRYALSLSIATLLFTSCSSKKEEEVKPLEIETTTYAGNRVSGYADATQPLLAEFSNPQGLDIDAQGNVYVADTYNHRIRKITPEGVVSTFAGSGIGGFADGAANVAAFNFPYALKVSATGDIYVADLLNHSIRKITSAGVVSTLAGTGVSGYAEGAGTVAQFDNPRGITLDAQGNIYVGDNLNHRIRKITPAGEVSTFAGDGVAGSDDGNRLSARFAAPRGLDIDANGVMYVADFANHKIRKIATDGTVSTLAGTGDMDYKDGAGNVAKFYYPADVAVSAQGMVYVADLNNNCIRRIVLSSGVVGTYSGIGVSGFSNEVKKEKYISPFGLCVDKNGNVYVADTGNHLIRKISLR